MKKERLFDQFPPVTTEEWMKKIHTDLKGVDFNKKLVWRTNEGFDVMPFYRSEDLDLQLRVRSKLKNNNSWLVRQDIEVTDYAEANSKALVVLMNGIDSLGFIIADPASVCYDNFRILLKDIHIEAIEINFLCNGMVKEILAHVISVVNERGLDPSGIHGAIEADPLGRLMVNGKLCIPPEAGFDYLASLTRAALALPNMRTAHLKASVAGNAGADIVQELAFAISMGNEYMAQLTDRGLATADAASKIRFSFSLGSDYFFEIAKLRQRGCSGQLCLKHMSAKLLFLKWRYTASPRGGT